jgi:CcmD family protein
MNTYLFAGYSLILILIFGYVAFLHGKLHKLGRELDELRDRLREKARP